MFRGADKDTLPLSLPWSIHPSCCCICYVSGESLYLCKRLFMGRRSLLFSPHWSVFTWWERQVLQGQREREWNDYGKCKQTLGKQQEKMLHKRLRFIREHWCYCAAVIRTTLQTLQSTEPPVRVWNTKLMQINESWWLSTIKQTPMLQQPPCSCTSLVKLSVSVTGVDPTPRFCLRSQVVVFSRGQTWCETTVENVAQTWHA